MRCYYPAELIFKIGAIADLQRHLNEQGISRPLIVTDQGVSAAGLVQKLLNVLDGGSQTAVFDETHENPVVPDVEKALEVYRSNNCDGVIALGGGSSIDCAKTLALISTHEGAVDEYAATHAAPRPIGPHVAPLIAIPTTAGTGSEVGRGLGISLYEGAPKLVIYSEHLIPKVTICDPELTLTMPPSVTASTGMDALSHCIEGYLSTTDHPIADALALDAISRIVRSLPRAVENGADIEARKDMLLAAVMAGMTMHKGLGPAHAAGVPLDILGLRHGVLISVLLPHAVRFLQPVAGDKLDRIAKAMGLQHGNEVADALLQLGMKVGMPTRLSDLGVEMQHIQPAAGEAEKAFFNRVSARKGTAEDYEAMLTAAL